MNRKRKRVLYGLFVCVIAFVFISIYAGEYIHNIVEHIPQNIYVSKDDTTTVDFNMPVSGDIRNTSKTINLNSPVTFSGVDKGSYQMDLKLFGVFDINTVSINVIDKNEVFVGGFQTGIYLKSDGLLVTKTENVKQENGESSCPAKDLIKTGDYITKINGNDVTSKKQLIALINKNNNENIELTVMRDGEEITQNIEPVKCDDGIFRVGIWVKDDTQGIGTVTYIKSNGDFVALGHGISDSDTERILHIKGGMLYNTNIVSVVKGTDGHPGEFVGTIDYKSDNIIGEINENSETGLYGKMNKNVIDNYNLSLAEIGYSYEVKKGNAKIRLYTDNNYKDYDIEIYNLNDSANKNITFEVTSQELIDYSNGIVQGMSGCPIIQNGKIIGAVTHVFVDNPTKGYGILIEKMIK